MHLGTIEQVDIPRQTATNMLTTLAERYPEALPHVVTALEARAGRGIAGLGQSDDQQEATQTRSWWQRGLDAVTDLGATAIEVIGKQKLSNYMDDERAEAAERDYRAQVDAAKRQATLAQAQAQEARAAAEYQRQLAQIEAAETSARIGEFMPWILVGGGAIVLWAMSR